MNTLILVIYKDYLKFRCFYIIMDNDLKDIFHKIQNLNISANLDPKKILESRLFSYNKNIFTKYNSDIFYSYNFDGSIIIYNLEGYFYNGFINDNLPDGYGKMILPDNSYYIGEWVEGLPCGKGCYGNKIYKYNGEWNKGNKHGNGELIIDHQKMKVIYENNKIINIFLEDIKIREENQSLEIDKAELFNKLEKKEKEIYDLKMINRNNKIDIDKFISIIMGKINKNSKEIDSIRENINNNSEAIYHNEINFDEIIFEFTKFTEEIDNINNSLHDMNNKNFMIQKMLDKYSKIEDDYNLLEYEYKDLEKKCQEINKTYNSLKSSSHLDIKLLKYEIGKLKRVNQEIHSKSEEIKEEYLCVICQRNKKDIILLPCNHYIICRECEENNYNITQERKCPICRNEYFDKMLLYT